MEILSVQEDLINQIERLYSNYKKSPKDRISKTYVESRLELLKQYWNEFHANHSEIRKSIPKKEHNAMDYFKNSVYENLQDLYLDFSITLKEYIYTHSPTQTTTTTQETTLPPKVKLPPIEIPKFTGKYREWMPFHDLYLSLVHNNASLTNVQKFHYLKGNLSGEAELLIKNIPLTDANYNEAWTLLTKRYNNKRVISNEYMNKLFNQRKLTTESAKGIKELLDNTNESLTALRNLDINTESWCPILAYLVLSKLDPETLKQFEQQNISDNIPTWSEVKKFLEARFRALELVQTQVLKKPETHRTFTAHVQEMKCIYCSDNHHIWSCKSFNNLDISEKRNFVQGSKACFNCLRKGHSATHCKSINKCRKCGKPHHSLLHWNSSHTSNVSNQVQNEPSQKSQTLVSTTQINEAEHHEQSSGNNSLMVATTSTYNSAPHVLLATALIHIQSSDGEIHSFRALVDQGSQATFITESACQRLKLKRSHVQGSIIGVDSQTMKTTIKSKVTLCIQASKSPNSFKFKTDGFVISSLVAFLPSQRIQIPDWPEITNIKLADPTYDLPSKVDILLGAEAYAQILLSGFMKHNNGKLIAQNTQLGWLLSGQVSNETHNYHIVIAHARMETDNLLQQFWEIENGESQDRKLNKEELLCESLYENTYKRDEDGRFIVKLPFKEKPIVGNSRNTAVHRQLKLEQRFLKNESLKIKYSEFMNEYLKSGHMEEIDQTELNKLEAFYLPHHAIINESHLTTKLRVVFDGSAETDGVSLNNNLLPGPPLQRDIREIILRWRQHEIVLVADIRHMYRQIKVDKDDAHYQRIVWRESRNEELKDYKLATVTYGTSCAPYLAIKTLRQLGIDERQNYPLVANILVEDFYMDDLMTGATNLPTAIKIKNQLIELLHKGGFKLHKWASNKPEILNDISTNDQQNSEVMTIPMDHTMKTLGICWKPSSDKFEAQINLPNNKSDITKRSVLSDIAKIFDPIGWLTPVVVVAKIMMQKLWLEKLDWDDPLSGDLLQQWLTYKHELINMQPIHLDRWLGCTSHDDTCLELHGFSDASTAAYAAVVYVRVINSSGIKVSIVEAKSKVAPVKQISIPRLELCSAVLLAKLLNRASTSLNVPMDNVYAYTDSEIVLAWLNKPSTTWQTFVANRVTIIDNLINVKRWHHIRSNNNPADIASRGCSPMLLKFHELWWNGPQCLYDYDYSRSVMQSDIPQTTLECKHKSVNIAIDDQPNILDKYSSLNRLIRVVAYCFKFVANCKSKVNGNNLDTTCSLNANNLTNALNVCIKISQYRSFSKEINALRANKNIYKGSKLLSLNPYLDSDCLLRVGGRLELANVEVNVKHPIILELDSLAYLIIFDMHHKTLHGNFQLMLNLIRNKYHIFSVKRGIKKCVKTCIRCIRWSAKPMNQIMGNLPIERITPCKPFLNSGIDFAGPINVKSSHLRGCKTYKCYIALFICLCTKAIHLELVTSLNTPDFIASFKRFIARRGQCKRLFSDCGTNFIGAQSELVKRLNKCKIDLSPEIVNLLANDGTEWSFIPPGTPHFGGIWEAGVKSTKYHIRRVIGDQLLTYEEYFTLLTQIEACLNSRPLVQTETLEALTPGHFLMGTAPLVVPDEIIESEKLTYNNRWKLVQQMLQGFWKRWSNEYLVTLQGRNKWKTRSKPLNVNDIVICKDERVPPTKWLIGRVIETHPGSDGQIRVVSIRTGQHKIIQRSIHRLVYLPINDSEPLKQN